MNARQYGTSVRASENALRHRVLEIKCLSAAIRLENHSAAMRRTTLVEAEPGPTAARSAFHQHGLGSADRLGNAGRQAQGGGRGVRRASNQARRCQNRAGRVGTIGARSRLVNCARRGAGAGAVDEQIVRREQRALRPVRRRGWNIRNTNGAEPALHSAGCKFRIYQRCECSEDIGSALSAVRWKRTIRTANSGVV